MIGIDAVDVERLRQLLARRAGLEERLFTPEERRYCDARTDPVVHLAGTLAAKEAVIKAASLGPLISWCRRIEIAREGSGAPVVRVDGSTSAMRISISHDPPVAVAVAIFSNETRRREPDMPEGSLRPNQRLAAYLRPAVT